MINVDNYLRFYTPIKINNDIFTIRIVAENNSNKNLFNVLNADIYDLIIDKKMPTSVHIPANTQSNIMKSTSNNIVANNSQNINPAQITIRDMLSNVEDADGNIYFQPATTVIKNDERNLLMTHNAKSDNIDAILESGNLIAPSFASKLKNTYNIDVIEYDDNIKNALKQVETEQPEIYFQTGINQGEITNIDGSIVNDVSNPLDYDYLNNQVTGEKVAIEINQDIKVEEIKPQNISSDLPFEISQKPSDNKKKSHKKIKSE